MRGLSDEITIGLDKKFIECMMKYNLEEEI